MAVETGTYDSPEAIQASLDRILNIFHDLGVTNVYVKRLAPNDNSKNQPYFGAHLTDLAFIPTGNTEASESVSRKPGKRRIKYQTSVDLSWVDANGQTYLAPNSKLIYYPQYPEVRFSGFLQGSNVDVGGWMDPSRSGRSEGRWLLLGVAPKNKIYAYLATPQSALANELANTEFAEISKVFGEIVRENLAIRSTRSELLAKLLSIHLKGWIPGQKMTKDGANEPYMAVNGGGYTLEAELGVAPNGIAQPDFLGWEVKQFGVSEFPAKGTSPTTLMTPEPNGGFYLDHTAAEFIRKYGYPARSGQVGRLNFGGVHRANKPCNATGLTMILSGYDPDSSTIVDASGALLLVDGEGNVAASWSFAKLIDHWKTKHAQAVYVPALRRRSDKGGFEYLFGQNIELGVGTDFRRFLSAMNCGDVFYDPGIKMENADSGKPEIKKRNQFRVKHKDLSSLYKMYEYLDLTED